MNKYIVTAQILNYIKLKKEKEIFLILLYIPNNIRSVSFIKILVSLDNRNVNDLLKLYQIGDICLVEGSLHNTRNYLNKYQLFVKIDQIFWCSKYL